jgi:beta-lactam-binding protein with PASTA domain
MLLQMRRGWLAAMACCAVWLLMTGCNGEQAKSPSGVSVPNVIELPLTQADSLLRSAGLRGVNDLQGGCPSGPSYGLGAPKVMDQEPSAGTRIQRGSVVHLRVC